jgi:hypothetical protein
MKKRTRATGGKNGEAAIPRGRTEVGIVVGVLELRDRERVGIDLMALFPGVGLPHDDPALLRLRTLKNIWYQNNNHIIYKLII